MNEELNLPEILHQITGTFEYELLVELLLRYFGHPFADDVEFRNTILESTAEILHRAAGGEGFGKIPSWEVNIVFSVCYLETNSIEQELNEELKEKRLRWLDTVKRALPSCFCDQDLLD